MCAGGCSEGVCGRCHARKKVVLGALVLLNIYVWPKWVGSIDKWLAFYGVLAIIGGIVMFIMPGCPHCKEDMPMKKMGKK